MRDIIVWMNFFQNAVRCRDKAPIRVLAEVPTMRCERWMQSRMRSQVVTAIIKYADQVVASRSRGIFCPVYKERDFVGTPQAMIQTIRHHNVVVLLRKLHLSNVGL